MAEIRTTKKMAAFGWRRLVGIEAALNAWCMEILLNVPGTIFGENGGRGFAAHPSKISPAPSEMSSENKIIFPGIFQETRKTFIFNRMKKQALKGRTLKSHAEGNRKILSLSISAQKNRYFRKVCGSEKIEIESPAAMPPDVRKGCAFPRRRQK